MRHRIAAQASDAQRRAACDVVLANEATREASSRPSTGCGRAACTRGTRTSCRVGTPVRPERGAVVAPRADWASRGARLVAKVAHALRDVAAVTEVEHVGSTSVPHLLAKDVLDLQVGVRELAVADARRVPCGHARCRPAALRRHHRGHPAPRRCRAGRLAQACLRVHGPEGDRARARPGDGSPAWRFALLFRDWLVHEASERDGTAAEKRRLLGLHDTTSAYAEAKEPWFAEAFARAQAWAAATNWTPR